MASEPIVRIHVLEEAGYYIDESVFDIDGQVARQLVAAGIVEIVDPETPPYDEINILPGPAGPGTSSPRMYQA